MTYDKIWSIISEVGLPCTYHHWEPGQVPPLPYLIFWYDERLDFVADDSQYQKIVSVSLELYSDRKNFQAEESVELVLERNGIVYSKTEDYISSEKLFMETYDFEVLLEVSSDGKEN